MQYLNEDETVLEKDLASYMRAEVLQNLIIHALEDGTYIVTCTQCDVDNNPIRTIYVTKVKDRTTPKCYTSLTILYNKIRHFIGMKNVTLTQQPPEPIK